MEFGQALGMAIFIVLGYIGLYLIIERICNCIEHCAMYKSYTEWQKSKNKYSSDGLGLAINDFMSGLSNKNESAGND